MTTTVSDYPNVAHKASELGLVGIGDLAFLPRGFDTAAPDDLVHEADAATLRKVLREEGLDIVQPQLPHQRGTIVVEKSADWIAPTIFIGSQLLSGRPELLSILLKVLEYHARRALRAVARSKVTLTFVVETKKGRSYKKLTYEGPPSSLDTIPQLIRELRDE